MRSFIGRIAVLGAAVATVAHAASADTGLVPLVFNPLPLGSIKPSGWLQSELQSMASGLAGHEHDFYMYVHNSSWLGGTSEYSDLNEGFPYWFNGLVPLAYGLDDDTLKAQVHSAADYVLSHQQSDGWIGPEQPGYRTFWGRYPFFLGLVGLAEANSTGWNQRVTDSLHIFNSLMNTMLKDNGTGYVPQQSDHIDPGDFSWGQVRSQDLMITLMWILENDPRNATDTITDNLNMLYEMGLKWEAWYNEAVYLKQDLYTVPDSITGPNYPFEHGVNVGQGLKATAIYRRFTHNDSLVQTSHDGVNWTMTYHGASSGTVLGDEREDGLSPYTGSELCTAVETMFSLSYLYQALGTNDFADKCELAAFNALPVMVTPNWWAHQYMAEPNQPNSDKLAQSPFYNVNTLGQTFGLEPDYPCCTVNHPQGFPKFLSASYVSVGTNGIAHALLSPAKVQSKLSSGTVSVDCQTNYPFSDELNYNIQSAGPFDFYVRLPNWATSAKMQVNGKTVTGAPDASTGLVKLSMPKGQSTASVVLSTAPRVENRANDTVAILRGSLLYALEVGADVSSGPPKAFNTQQEFPSGYAPPQAVDYTMTNTTVWSVAIDPSTLKFNQTNPSSLANPIFAPGAAPVSMTVKACEIDWPLFVGSVPGVPLAKEDRKCLGPTFDATLIPYGGAKLHMAELPTIDLSSS